MAGTRVPMRDIIGFATPKQVTAFGDKIGEKLVRDNAAKQAAYERSGKISGGKLGKPTLWAVLDLLGVPDEEYDSYLLGKFQRGNDVEDRAIQFLTDIDPKKVKPGEKVKAPKTAVLSGEFTMQMEGGYRGGVGFIDLTQHALDGDIYHEIKSVTKMAYDKVAATGRSFKGEPEPYYHHCLQLAYYCLGANIDRAFLHYFNADDYRLTTFSLNPLDYKEEIDYEIDQIQSAFITKTLPAFEGFLQFHKLKAYWSYKAWNELTPEEMMVKLETEYPEQYKKFMETTLGV